MNEFKELEREYISHEEWLNTHCCGCGTRYNEKNKCPICDYKNKKQLILK